MLKLLISTLAVASLMNINAFAGDINPFDISSLDQVKSTEVVELIESDGYKPVVSNRSVSVAFVERSLVKRTVIKNNNVPAFVGYLIDTEGSSRNNKGTSLSQN